MDGSAECAEIDRDPRTVSTGGATQARTTGAHAASTAEVLEIIRRAQAERTSLAIAGAGSWSAAGRPVSATSRLTLRPTDNGITEYEPGDLTLTCWAGTPLSIIEGVTRVNGQFLALDPAGSADGSIGATVATASSGASAHAFGQVRDNVLGIEFVTGDGLVARGGGRVVKNVAGFDLVRLLTGSWGALGVITEVTIRLRALPEVDETLAIALPAANESDHLLSQLRQLPFLPLACEIVNGALAATLSLEPVDQVLVRVGGNASLVRAATDSLRSLGTTTMVPAGVWNRIRAADPASTNNAAPVVARLSGRVSRIADTWRLAKLVSDALGGALLHATLGRGTVRLIAPAHDTAVMEAAFRQAREQASIVFERIPAPLWDSLAPSPLENRVSRDIKHRFDPHGILNPGIWGEGSSTLKA